jgi:hypothetical protein
VTRVHRKEWPRPDLVEPDAEEEKERGASQRKMSGGEDVAEDGGRLTKSR